MKLLKYFAFGALFTATSLGCSASDADTSPADGGLDAAKETSADALPDAPAEAAVDAPAEAAVDAPAEAAVDATAEASGPRVLATIETSKGTIVVELDPAAAPVTVENFQKYADAQYYDGLIFHRVIPDFMIQGGGFEPGMTSRATLYPPIVNEAASSGLSNLRGTIAMARTSVPDSATSQFFINTADNEFLDPTGTDAGYAVFGQVVEGMSVVDAIESAETGTVGSHEDVPVEDILIESVVVAEQ